MDKIKDEILKRHFENFPEDKNIINYFISDFYINWGSRRRAYNTDLSVFILGPEKHIRESFGFEREVILAVPKYKTLQPRVMQAIESFFNDEPAKGRVDQSVFLIYSVDPNAEQWVDEYTSQNPQSRIPIVFTPTNIQKAGFGPWKIKNIIHQYLYYRDFFDYQLPVNNDLFFFGRDALVAEYIDAIKKSQNKGLFGLRKTGKTSLLYKIRRLAEKSNIANILYYDCKLPSIRNLGYEDLLHKIMYDIEEKVGVKLSKNTQRQHPSELFLEAISSISRKKPLCLIFDEIEYISPFSTQDNHWQKDFISFWQTLWAAQSEHRKMSFVIAGVNPTVAEQVSFDGVQNPMFAIVRPNYLRGLNISDLKKMIQFFSQKMGLIFEESVFDYLYHRYGGHPLLTRMACSYEHKINLERGLTRPMRLSKKDLENTQNERDEELLFYCRHIVSVLQEFYACEYELLEFLAQDNEADFMDLAVEPEWTRHLRQYGMIEINSVKKPTFTMPVVKKYVASEIARKKGKTLLRSIVDCHSRNTWILRRKESIIKEVRQLEKIARVEDLPEIYGNHSFPEAERFSAINICSSESEFDSFINTMNRCFVEPISRLGNQKKLKNYLFSEIKEAYPEFWDALNRINLYRHSRMHLELKPQIENAFKNYMMRDLEGYEPHQIQDGWFILQQSVLDNLIVGIQCSINRYS